MRDEREGEGRRGNGRDRASGARWRVRSRASTTTRPTHSAVTYLVGLGSVVGRRSEREQTGEKEVEDREEADNLGPVVVVNAERILRQPLLLRDLGIGHQIVAETR